LRSGKKYRRDESEMTVFESTPIESVIHEAKKLVRLLMKRAEFMFFA
jgi:hypothetical protein